MGNTVVEFQQMGNPVVKFQKFGNPVVEFQQMAEVMSARTIRSNKSE